MADCLIYWKEFWADCDQFDSEELGPWNFYYHTKQVHFFDQLSRKDNLWLVVFDSLQTPGDWLLVAKIYVRDKKHHPQWQRPYQVVGDRAISKFFDVRPQGDLSALLKTLDFISGRKITADGLKIAQSLQKIRPLTKQDNKVLEEYSKGLNRISKLSDVFE